MKKINRRERARESEGWRGTERGREGERNISQYDDHSYLMQMIHHFMVKVSAPVLASGNRIK